MTNKAFKPISAGLVLISAATVLVAQRIETATPSRDRVRTIHSGMGHLTVVEVCEPITTVALASPQAFRVERRENKVLIQPLVENVASNLFIWTSTTRYSYELAPATTDVQQMDFVIDCARPPSQAKAASPPAPIVNDNPGSAQILLGGTPVRLIGKLTTAKNRPSVLIRDVYRRGDEVVVRYSVENGSNRSVRLGIPTAVKLTAPRLEPSLWGLQHSQLGSDVAARLKIQASPISVPITSCEPGVAEVSPGGVRLALITLKLPIPRPEAPESQPIVLQLQFPIDATRSVTATLVL